jgi:hypothetical protein
MMIKILFNYKMLIKMLINLFYLHIIKRKSSKNVNRKIIIIRILIKNQSHFKKLLTIKILSYFKNK